MPEPFFVAGHFQFTKGDGVKTQSAIKELLQKRSASQPIGTLNCGSVFRNPPNDYAARLIESVGLKGYRIGDAVVSTKHANFIINEGAAKATDIEQLIYHVQNEVLQKTGVHLVRECIILGESHA